MKSGVRVRYYRLGFGTIEYIVNESKSMIRLDSGEYRVMTHDDFMVLAHEKDCIKC